MSVNDVKNPEIKIKFKDEEWNVKFTLRNFAALQDRYGVSENELLQGLIKGDIRKLPYAIWASTIVFAPFDPAEPTKIEKEIPLEDLFNLDLQQTQDLTQNVVKAMEAFLPGGNEQAKKPVGKKSSK